MDTDDQARLALDALVRERGEDYAALSRLIGRNAAYIQQYVKRGSPRRLAERDRALLARYFGVAEETLGAPVRPEAMERRADGLAIVRRFDLGASAGAGARVDEDGVAGGIGFDPRWLKQFGANASMLSMIRVEGDSMAPTLRHGDDIMVNAADDGARLRDGIYVLRRDGELYVKRIARGAGGTTVSILSDNPAYPPIEGCALSDLEIVGRVVWTGRRLD